MQGLTDRVCANPVCFCQTPEFTCSPWCGTLDIPAGIRCLCRHDECARARARRAPAAVTRHDPGAGDFPKRVGREERRA